MSGMSTGTVFGALGGCAAGAAALGEWVPGHPAHGFAGPLAAAGIGALGVSAFATLRGGVSSGDAADNGLARPREIKRVAGRRAMRRRACVLRPSFAGLSGWERLRAPTRSVATPLVRSGRHWVWSSVEDVTLRVGGPRTGKTGEIACRILDAPGAVIATSTRADLVKLTSAIRSNVGPVWIFNPSGFADIPTTLAFNPVAGCEHITIAAHRASDLLAATNGPGRGAERDFWSEQAERVLRCLVHAAALDGGSMHDVLAWVADPDQSAAQIRRLLRRSQVRALEDDATQFLTTNDTTRSSICASVMPALRWLTDPAAAGVAVGDGLDVAELLRERATIYLIGGEDAMVAPLVTALTGHIAREARRIAGLQPAGRLDPPLTLVLDEAALVCPIPLDRWTADMGGRNITIHIAVQSRAQLRQRWGDTGAAAILNNAATLLIFGGTRDPGDLDAYATLLGERVESVHTRDGRGRTTSVAQRRSPILTSAQIAHLPSGTVIAIRRGMRPVIGRTVMAWERRDVRVADRQITSTGVQPVPLGPAGEVR